VPSSSPDNPSHHTGGFTLRQVKLSLAMIVRDEAETLGRILAEAAQFCDELVVVDTGSTDGSQDIAKNAGARVFDFEWIDDFAAARQCAFDACQGEWIIWLDADDSIAPEVQERMRQAKDQLLTRDVDAIYTPYRYHFDPDTGQCTFSFNRERIVRRVPGLRWVGAVHEAIEIPGTRLVQRDDLYIEHRPDPQKTLRRAGRNLRIIEKAVQGGDRSSRSLYYYACELRDAGRDEEALAAYRDYLDDPGINWEEYAARLSMSECARRCGRDEEAIDLLFSAVRLDPSRSEAFLGLGKVHFDLSQWEQAVSYYAAAASATRPAAGFVSDFDYTWRPWDYLGVCLANSGRHAEAIKATMRSLQLGNPDRDRLRQNLHWSVDHIPE
jgi:glycosyltransferase involved in cell wall biosynthesis